MTNKTYTVVIAQQVVRDLNEIERYLVGWGTYQSTIDQFVEHIYQSIEQLQVHPFSGVSLNHKTPIPTKIRYLVVDNYLIFYQVNDEVVSVIRILSEKQEYLRILKF